MPKLQNEMTTNQLIQSFKATEKIVILHEGATTPISQLNLSQEFSSIYLIIGPEGGISDNEIKALTNAGGVSAKMGELVLRSAHAGFAGLAAIQTSIGRW